MPTYEITAPNGKKYRVTGDGTADEALAHFQQRYASATDPSETDPSSPAFQQKYGPLSSTTALDRFRAGAGKAFVDTARGAGQLVGAVSADDVRASRERDAPLMSTGMGKVGNIAGGVAVAAPAAFVPGANTVAGATLIGGAYGALQPSTSTGERLQNAAVGAAAGGASQYIGNKIANWASQRLANRATSAATRQAQNTVRDMTLTEARKAGYVVPPSAVNPTAANAVIESLPGKAATAQQASYRNQQVTNSLARKALGLPENEPLVPETLEALRANAGKVYEAVKSAGRIAVDFDYIDDLAGIGDAVERVAKDFPDLNIQSGKEVSALVDGLLVEGFDSRSGVELVKKLRADAAANLSVSVGNDPAKKALGAAQREAAGVVEDLIERHLQATGKGDLAKAFDGARRLIAKSWSVQSALNESTGNVVASQLGSQLRRGKPLSGELETIARFARAFRPYTQELMTGSGVSNLDAAVTAAASMVNPAALAYPVGRAAARATVLSGPYQNMLARPNYAPGTTVNALLQGIRQGGRNAAIPAAVLGVEAVQQ
jgi:hypothetical protein